MNTLYIITGPAGVGKSTISNNLAKEIKDSVLIEGDEIYHQVINGYVSPWKEGNHLNTFWKVIKSMINAYLEDGYNVIFNYIVNEENLEMLKECFKEYDKKFVVLIVDEKTLIKRDVMRPLDCQMGNRCITLLNNFKEKNYEKRFFLDTSKLSVKDSMHSILENDNFKI